MGLVLGLVWALLFGGWFTLGLLVVGFLGALLVLFGGGCCCWAGGWVAYLVVALSLSCYLICLCLTTGWGCFIHCGFVWFVADD